MADPVNSGMVGAGDDISAGASDIDFLNQGGNDPDPTKTGTGEETKVPPAPAPDDKNKKEDLEDIEDPDKPKPEDTQELSEEEKAAEAKKAAATEDVPEPNEPVDITKLREAYPDIFKKNPHLRQTIIEHTQLKTAFPTMEAARQAFQMRNAHVQLAKTIMDGDPELLLNSTKDENPEALKKLSRNFLSTLKKVDLQTYQETLDPIVKTLLRQVKAQGETSGNKNLVLAAQHIANLIYNTIDIPAEQPEPAEDPKAKELDERERQFNARERHRFAVGINSTLRNDLVREFNKGLDPENAMTPLVRKAALDSAMAELNDVLIKDEQHQAAMQSLFQHAEQNEFGGDWSERIRTAYLGRVRPLLPALRQKYRKEALGDKVGKLETDKDKTPEKKPSSVPSSGNPASGKLGSGKVDWRRTSDEDFLNGKVTYVKP